MKRYIIAFGVSFLLLVVCGVFLFGSRYGLYASFFRILCVWYSVYAQKKKGFAYDGTSKRDFV